MPKIVIDIPKDKYNEIMKDDYIPDGNFRKNCIIAIRNGTPLDDIKAEIPTLSHWQSDDGQDLAMVADVLECIDKHIGERSE